MSDLYLDHISSTPVLPEVLEVMQPFFADNCAGSNALHRRGVLVRDALDQARQQCARLINAAAPEEILFTASGTEAANLALKGFALSPRTTRRHLVLSAVEHPAVLEAAAALEPHGFRITRIAPDAQGLIQPDAVRAALTADTALLCVQHANPDSGAVQPVEAIGAVAAAAGVPFFVDATASGGWRPIDVRALGAALLTLSPHRFHGPKGVGVLYRERRLRLMPQIHGGVQEQGLRAGTENVPAIVGAGRAAELACGQLVDRALHTHRLQGQLLAGVRARIPRIALNGPEPGPQRLPHHLSLSPEDVEGEALALRLDMQGIAVGSGPSCISRSLKISHVLAAMGLDHARAQAAITLGLGATTTEADVATAVEAFAKAVTWLREMSPAWGSASGATPEPPDA